MRGRKAGFRDSLETKIRKREVQLIRLGREVSQASDILDLYLAGESLVEIAAAYKLTKNVARSQMCKEALFRLMQAQAVERLDELENVERKLK